MRHLGDTWDADITSKLPVFNKNTPSLICREAIICFVLLFVGCAYPQQVKDLSKEQLQLMEEFDTTTQKFHLTLRSALERHLYLRDKAELTNETHKAINTHVSQGITGDILEEHQKIKLEAETSAKEVNKQYSVTEQRIHETIEELDTQFEALHAQMLLVIEGQNALDKFINVDITLEKEKVGGLLQELKEAVKKIQEKKKQEEQAKGKT